MSTLVKTNRFPSLGSMMNDFWNTDKFFSTPLFNGETLPAVNIRETKNKFELEVAAPGYKKEDFKVSVENRMLNISAETSIEKNEEQESYTRKEFSCASFTRTFTLPENVLEEDINAKYQDGLLSVELKKSGKPAVVKKEVKVN